MAWSLVEVPEGSLASLDNASSPMPAFIADVHGDYRAELIVNDGFAPSKPDSVTVSFQNVRPVADAGMNQSVIRGETVHLSGARSHDGNLDPLIYSWSLVSAPYGSAAALVDLLAVETSFVADVPGSYVVSLVVNDGLVDSDPSNMTVVAITAQDAVKVKLQLLMAAINGLSDSDLKNGNMKNARTNKINAVLRAVDVGLWQDALNKMENDIKAKTDGCAIAGAPDANDWIITSEAQGQVYPLIVSIIGLLGGLP